jgi:hypothetical protein
METNDKKFSMIAYCADYRDNCGDNMSSKCHFHSERDLAVLEAQITNYMAYAEEEEDWEFLILYKGLPIAARGDSFESHVATITEESKPLAYDLNAMFTRANLHTREMKQERERERQREAAERARKFREQEEERRYADAKLTIQRYEAQRAVKP